MHSWVLIHMGTNDTAREDLEASKSDLKALGAKVNSMGVQVLFSIFLVKSKSLGRSRCAFNEIPGMSEV